MAARLQPQAATLAHHWRGYCAVVSMDKIVLYVVEYDINGRTFGVNLPASSFKHAEKLVSGFGGRVLGSDVHKVSSIPVEQLMEFCNHISDEPIRWKYNAGEQLEAFLSIGWPENPMEIGS